MGQKKRVPKSKWDIIDDLKEKGLERKQKEKRNHTERSQKVMKKEKSGRRKEKITTRKNKRS